MVRLQFSRTSVDNEFLRRRIISQVVRQTTQIKTITCQRAAEVTNTMHKETFTSTQ